MLFVTVVPDHNLFMTLLKIGLSVDAIILAYTSSAVVNSHSN